VNVELIESEADKEQGTLPEPEPRYRTANLPVERTEHGQAWVRIVAAAVLAVILIVIIVLLARWIYHKAHNNTTPPTTRKGPSASVNNPPAKPAPSSNSNSSSNSGSSGNSNGSGNSSAGQIANTGPGDVAAIFAGASLAAGGLHYLISVRRFAKNS
jgi:uncharacterized membrane protein YgcG